MATLQIRYGTGSATQLLAGELYANSTLDTLQLSTNGSTTVTLLTSASIVNAISASLETTILNVSSSVSTSIGLALGNLTGESASFFTTINNLSSSVYSTDSTEINNITINSASAWGAYQSASSYSASAYTSINSISQSISSSLSSVSSSLENSIQNITSTYAATASVSQSIYNNVWAPVGSVSSSVSNLSASLTTTDNTISASAWGVYQSASSYSASNANWDNTQDNRITSLENYSASLKSAIELTGSNVTIQGDLFVRGTTTTVNSTTVNLSASFIEVDAGGGVNGGIYVIDKVNNAGGLTITGSLFWDVTNDVWKAGKSGSEQELAHIQDIAALSASMYLTNATQSNNIATISASAWGAFQSASAYSKSVYDTLYWPSTGLSASLSSGSQYQVNILSASLYDSIFGLSPSALSYSIHQNIYGDGYSTTGLSGSISSSISQLSSSVSQSIYNNVWGNVNSVSYSFASASAAYSSSVSQSLYQTIFFPSTGLSASIYTRDANQDTLITQASASAWGAFQSASSYSASLETSILNLSASVAALSIAAGANTAADNIFTGNNTFTKYITGSISGAVYGLGDTQLYSQSVASRLTKVETTYATTASNTFNGSQNVVGDITASGNLFVSGTIYAHELHTIIESASVIFSSGSNNIGDQQSDVLTITGSLNQTGSTSFSELTGSLFAFSSSLDNRINSLGVGALSASIYQTDITQSNNITNLSSSLYTLSGSVYTISSSVSASIHNLSSSIATTDSTQTTNITAASASAASAFASASSYSSSFYTTINNLSSSIATTDSASAASNASILNSLNNLSGAIYTTDSASAASITALSASIASTDAGQATNITIAQNSANGAFASASAYSASAVTTYAKLAVANTFTQNQIISGSLTVTGDVVAYAASDERLKDNIQLISNPIEKVQQLRGVEFDWNDKVQMYTGEHSYGVIAQDVLNVMPELVKQRYDGYYGVDYEKMVGLLIEVVKNQEKRIKELENKMGS